MRSPSALVAPVLALGLAACSAFDAHSLQWIDGSDESTRYGSSALNIRWTKQLAEEQGGPFIPVENAAAAFDTVRDRLYVGSADGRFYGLDSHGQAHFVYNPGAGIEAAPAVDTHLGQVFVAAEDGRVHSLEADGSVRWVESAGGPVRQSPLLDDDSLYLAREDDAVAAMSRATGEVFWTYRREGTVEFSISGRSGLVRVGDNIVAGFSDGTVVALNATDGSVAWERITAVDVEREEGAARQFYDIDTTPVLHQGVLYVGSFSAGLYALDPNSGTVLWREEGMQGITGLAAHGRMLMVASAQEGIRAYDLRRRETVWSLPNEHGAPTTPVIAAPYVLVAETLGSLRALRIAGGEEVARIDLGTGFSSAPVAYGRYGFAVSNGGRLIAFVL